MYKQLHAQLLQEQHELDGTSTEDVECMSRPTLELSYRCEALTRRVACIDNSTPHKQLLQEQHELDGTSTEDVECMSRPTLELS
ncbi:hypothetical protein J6590_043446 [Homalodisca vitripennis]|nr:hypothetical protein J6590_043446 [Homalodisca vitripennis]